MVKNKFIIVMINNNFFNRFRSFLILFNKNMDNMSFYLTMTLILDLKNNNYNYNRRNILLKIKRNEEINFLMYLNKIIYSFTN
jgi:hypothetical protein